MAHRRPWQKIYACCFLAAAMLLATGCPWQPGKQGAQTPPGKSSPELNPLGAPSVDDSVGDVRDAAVISSPPPLFANWGQPRFTLVVTGELWGYLEPCGCAGLEHQKGGVGRLHDLVNQLREKDWHPVPVDLGSLVRRRGMQQEIKFDVARRALLQIGYEALAFGEYDLKYMPADSLLAQFANSYDDTTGQPRLFVSANVTLPGGDDLPRFRVAEAAGSKVGITSVVGSSLREDIAQTECEIADPRESLRQALHEMRSAGCDHFVLLSHAKRDESQALAQEFPDFSIVATTGGADEPPPGPQVLHDGGTWLVEVGHKGMYAAVIGFFDGEPLRRFQLVPLDARFHVTGDMKQLLDDYQEQLRGIVESQGFSGLDLYAEVHPRAEGADDSRGHFVGANACRECHRKAFAVWRDRGMDPSVAHAHFKATQTLEKLGRLHDPECLACHVTGWDPKRFAPYLSGFQSLIRTGELVGNGCENCHGPGKAHVDAEWGRDQALKDRLRQEMKQDRGKAATGLCRVCHDLDNSPAFDFETYWPKVEHRGKD